MSNAYTRYTGDGANATFAVPFKFLDKEDVQVHVNGQPVGYTWLSEALLTTEAPPAYGAIVEVRRFTPEEPRAVDFTNGSILTDTDLDTANDQPIYIAQESIDKTERCLQRGWDDSYDFQSHPLRNIPQPVLAGDPVRLGDLQAWAPGGQTPVVLPDGPGAIPRTFDDIARDEVNVLSFIPAAWRDAIRARTTQNDVSIYVQKAIDYVYSLGGGELYFPRGLYLCHNLVVKSRVRIRGSGRLSTVIKLADGSNRALIISDGFDSLTGTNSQLGLDGFEIRDITLDGNRSKNTAGSVLVLFGQKPVFENLYVKDAPEDGIWTEWGRGGEDDFGMEGMFRQVRVDRCGRHGWAFNGPHDSSFMDIKIIDASLSGAGLGINLRVDGNANGQFYAVHTWQRNDSPRSAYGLSLKGFGGCEFTSCHFEGSKIPGGIFTTGNLLENVRFYAASGGGCTLFLGETCVGNTIRGYIGQVNPGYPDVYGVIFGSGATDYIQNNVIDVTTHLQNLGQVNYGSKSGGGNVIKIRGFAEVGGYDWVGTPHAYDYVVRDIRVQNAASLHNTNVPGVLLAYACFDGTNGNLQYSHNVTNVSKLSKGVWRVNFAERLETGKLVTATCSSGPGPGNNTVCVPYGNGEWSQDVQIFNTASQAPDDGSNFITVGIFGT